jgi:hypothetical protein
MQDNGSLDYNLLVNISQTVGPSLYLNLLKRIISLSLKQLYYTDYLKYIRVLILWAVKIFKY